MVDRDDGVLRGAARDAPADFMAVFGGNYNCYTVADGTPGTESRREKTCLYGDRGGIPIVQRNVLPIDRGAFGGDGSGGAGLVVLVTHRRVFGGDGEASRVARDLEAVAAVGADSDLLRRIDGRPHPRRGDDAAFCGIGGFGRGDDFAAYGGGVSRSGRRSSTAAGRGTGGKQCRYGQYRYQL